MNITEDKTLAEALGFYIGKLKEEERHQAQQEVSKFVRWCGRDRTFAQLTPYEIGEYGELMAASRTGPDAAKRLESVRGFLSYVHKEGLVQNNLAQHAKFRKAKRRVRGSAKVKSPTVVQLTAEGYEEIKSSLQLLKEREVRVAKEIHLAAADKDVRENAPLEAAREQQGQIQSRMRELEATLKAAIILSAGEKPQEISTVRLGSLVQLQDVASGQKVSYRVVSPSEASPLDGKISSVSPVGEALLNRSPGQEVVVATPGGAQRYLILEVSH